MSRDLMKRAAEMLLGGATLLGEPCPYCKGVRVIKDGHALCIGCGTEPEKKDVPTAEVERTPKSQLEMTLERKIESLSKDLERESDYERQQGILKSINLALKTLEKIKGGSSLDYGSQS